MIRYMYIYIPTYAFKYIPYIYIYIYSTHHFNLKDWFLYKDSGFCSLFCWITLDSTFLKSYGSSFARYIDMSIYIHIYIFMHVCIYIWMEATPFELLRLCSFQPESLFYTFRSGLHQFVADSNKSKWIILPNKPFRNIFSPKYEHTTLRHCTIWP